ncbi:Pre-mRNA polyadenylation factor FIP1 [Hyphodiscus hymeniophilus]|uniref:Pre-mRNA polyadenylation factor FIP1 n=1 Tax=Hyphodiscus hymeniophilus TaxID=353542 RepID=A0A9P6VRV1_9HELO|nr:Pre-mRNA polyadenylation factor FIP1 [Hyphodiscus hymeniophilus]
MDVDEDDDFYGDGTKEASEQEQEGEGANESDVKAEQEEEGLEEGEEEDSEGSDSDIEIVTERKEGTSAAPTAPTAKYNNIRNIPERAASSDIVTKPAAVKKEALAKATPPVSGANLPGISSSKIDVNAKPIYEPAGKPITQVNIDEDLNENDKPWRRPGTDVSDYFNYGFDEFTWALYASKQDSLRSEYSQDKVAQNNKKMMEDLNMMMMGGMPGMAGMPAAGGAAMPGMEGMTPEMQAMMQQMMAQGIDPSQMDPAAMFGAMQGNAATSGSGAQGGNQQGFGGQGGFGQGQNQMGYGYEQGMEGRNRGGNFGRGRGGRRNW